MTGDQLREILTQFDLTQKGLAELLDVTPLTPLRWLSGASPIPTGTALFLRYLQNGRVTLDEARAMRRLYES